MKKISCIVPCYNEEESLPIFYKEICKVAAEMAQVYNVAFEFVFVNDGSKDKNPRYPSVVCSKGFSGSVHIVL